MPRHPTPVQLQCLHARYWPYKKSIGIFCSSSAGVYFVHKIEFNGFVSHFVLWKCSIITFIFECIAFFDKNIAGKFRRLTHNFSANDGVISFEAMAVLSALDSAGLSVIIRTRSFITSREYTSHCNNIGSKNFEFHMAFHFIIKSQNNSHSCSKIRKTIQK